MSGSTPLGVRHDQDAGRNEQEAARWVRSMFGRVAHRYDLANHLLSFNIDRYWRAHTVRRTREILRRPEARILDICCGTGDLVLALSKQGRPVLGSDFCHPMLVAAHEKIARRHAPHPAAWASIRRRSSPEAASRRTGSTCAVTTTPGSRGGSPHGGSGAPGGGGCGRWTR